MSSQTTPVQAAEQPDNPEVQVFYRPYVAPVLDPNDEGTVVEQIDGQQILSPRPAAAHAGIATRLGNLLGTPYQLRLGGPGGWFFLDEPELHLGPCKDILVPDLAGWRRERYTDELAQATFLTLVPDWVCEVLSPATERLDRTKKLRIYALEIYRLEDGRYSLLETADDSVPRELEPFGPFRLDLLWPPLV